ncbi:hypothetical protein GVAV_003483 [Gurleya vavrai]
MLQFLLFGILIKASPENSSIKIRSYSNEADYLAIDGNEIAIADKEHIKSSFILVKTESNTPDTVLYKIKSFANEGAMLARNTEGRLGVSYGKDQFNTDWEISMDDNENYQILRSGDTCLSYHSNSFHLEQCGEDINNPPPSQKFIITTKEPTVGKEDTPIKKESNDKKDDSAQNTGKKEEEPKPTPPISENNTNDTLSKITPPAIPTKTETATVTETSKQESSDNKNQQSANKTSENSSTQDQSKETNKDQSKETNKDQSKETNKDQSKETIKDQSKETNKDQSKETNKDKSKENPGQKETENIFNQNDNKDNITTQKINEIPGIATKKPEDNQNETIVTEEGGKSFRNEVNGEKVVSKVTSTTEFLSSFTKSLTTNIVVTTLTELVKKTSKTTTTITDVVSLTETCTSTKIATEVVKIPITDVPECEDEKKGKITCGDKTMWKPEKRKNENVDEEKENRKPKSKKKRSKGKNMFTDAIKNISQFVNGKSSVVDVNSSESSSSDDLNYEECSEQSPLSEFDALSDVVCELNKLGDFDKNGVMAGGIEVPEIFKPRKVMTSRKKIIKKNKKPEKVKKVTRTFIKSPPEQQANLAQKQPVQPQINIQQQIPPINQQNIQKPNEYICTTLQTGNNINAC